MGALKTRRIFAHGKPSPEKDWVPWAQQMGPSLRGGSNPPQTAAQIVMGVRGLSDTRVCHSGIFPNARESGVHGHPALFRGVTPLNRVRCPKWDIGVTHRYVCNTYHTQ